MLSLRSNRATLFSVPVNSAIHRSRTCLVVPRFQVAAVSAAGIPTIRHCSGTAAAASSTFIPLSSPLAAFGPGQHQQRAGASGGLARRGERGGGALPPPCGSPKCGTSRRPTWPRRWRGCATSRGTTTGWTTWASSATTSPLRAGEGEEGGVAGLVRCTADPIVTLGSHFILDLCTFEHWAPPRWGVDHPIGGVQACCG